MLVPFGLVDFPEAPGEVPPTPCCPWPDAASNLVSMDLIAVIEASWLAGIVTADSSSHSHLMKRMPQVPSICADSSELNPIDSPRTSLVLSICHASVRRCLSVPSSAMSATSPCTSMPLSVTLADVIQPIGCPESCIHSNGIGSLNCAPFGSTMSPMRSVLGVEAMPLKMRLPPLSDVDLISRVEYARFMVPPNKKGPQ